MSYRFDCTEPGGRRRGIERATVSVTSGSLVVFPVDSAYGIGCDAFNLQATEHLRRVKGQGRNQPPPVLIGHTRTVDGIATDLSPAARELMAAFWPGPLTVLCRAQPTLSWDLGDTGGLVAVRVPLHPVALQLLDATGPMAVTGANPPGVRQQPQSCHEVRDAFLEEVECYLDAGYLNRPEVSTIVDVTAATPVVLRAGAISVEQLRSVVPEIDPPAEPPPAAG